MLMMIRNLFECPVTEYIYIYIPSTFKTILLFNLVFKLFNIYFCLT